jgi:alkyl hydroperoxide reductase subunit AhpC
MNVVGPDKRIKLMLTYPMTTGRQAQVATPVNWKHGEDVIIAGLVIDDDAKKFFPGGWTAPRSYLRITKQATNA